jgi:hypothetical protein
MNEKIATIQRELKIPISDVMFSATYVEIISGRDNIGSIPYYTVAGINTYDTDKSAVNWLKWDKVYDQHKAELNQKIIDLVAKEDITISLGTFRRLYVKNSNGEMICAIECSYNGNDWDVQKE